jgi:4-hydroxy-tetrahydrodipicolinate reductase
MPEGARALASARTGVKAIIGTTGFSDAQKAEIAACAQRVVFAPNMSVGVNVLRRSISPRALGAATRDRRAHHQHKAPSCLRESTRSPQPPFRRKLSDCAVYSREGHTGARDPSTIGFATIRAATSSATHGAFAGTGERIEISHKSGSRATYAQGALRAARFVAARANGLFDMGDVLGLGTRAPG